MLIRLVIASDPVTVWVSYNEEDGMQTDAVSSRLKTVEELSYLTDYYLRDKIKGRYDRVRKDLMNQRFLLF